MNKRIIKHFVFALCVSILVINCNVLFGATKVNFPKKITQEMFEKDSKDFVSYVLDLQSQLSVRNKWYLGGEVAVEKGARHVKGCDDTAIKCMKLSYIFFDQDPKVIEKECRSVQVSQVNKILEQISDYDLNRLAAVSYKEQVNSTNLPPTISKEALENNPDLYKKLVEEGVIDKSTYNDLTVKGLLARFYVEKK